MSELGIAHYAAVFLGAAALTLVLVPLAMRVAVRHGVFDEPGGYKKQASPVPYLGGVAIVSAFSVAVLAAALVRPSASGFGEIAVILGLALVLSGVGLIDDLRNLGPWVRLVVMVAAAIALWSAGVGIDLVGESWADGLLTVLWVVGITNAFNLLDNMDGLSAGVAALASAAFFVIAALNGQFLVAALSAGLAGCACGFLRHNFHPAKIYMGDAGSLFLGFVLAVLGIKLRFDAPRDITFMVPIIVLGVAIFDTSLVTITRVANRLNPLSGGRDHVSHRLVFIGMPVRIAVGLIYGVQIVLGWLALAISRLDDSMTAYIIGGLVLALAAVGGTALGSLPVHERSRRRHLIITDAPPAGRVGPRSDAQDEATSALISASSSSGPDG